MNKFVRALYPKGAIRSVKKLFIPALRKKWKKDPTVSDWVKRGWIKDEEIDALVYEWEKFKSPVTPPHKVKQLTIAEYAKKYDCSILVETGTYRGDMMEAQKKNFKKLYSVELAKVLWEKAVQRFRNDKNIELLQGDSAVVLHSLVPKLEDRALFWLDGHYCGGVTAMGEKECPIYEEMDAVFKNNKGHVMLVDDARLFVGKRDYPTIPELTAYVKKINSDYQVSVADDIIRIVKS
jgi:hypothetical protein